MSYKVGFDVDGVLADFTSGYIAKLEKSGRRCTLGEGQDPHCWNWPVEYGFTKEDDDAAWRDIKQDPLFWASLKPMLEAHPAISVLKEMYNAGHEVYFITNRMGIGPHMQTVMFLSALGMPLPQVIICEKKGPLAEGLALTHFIDDKFENVCDVAAYTLDKKTKLPTCKVFLLNKAYNKDKLLPLTLGIIRVDTLKEFFLSLAFEEVNAVA